MAVGAVTKLQEIRPWNKTEPQMQVDGDLQIAILIAAKDSKILHIVILAGVHHC